MLASRRGRRGAPEHSTDIANGATTGATSSSRRFENRPRGPLHRRAPNERKASIAVLPLRNARPTPSTSISAKGLGGRSDQRAFQDGRLRGVRRGADVRVFLQGAGPAMCARLPNDLGVLCLPIVWEAGRAQIGAHGCE